MHSRRGRPSNRTVSRFLIGPILILLAQGSVQGEPTGGAGEKLARGSALGADLAGFQSDTPAPSRVAREVFWLEAGWPQPTGAEKTDTAGARGMIESRRLPARIAREPGLADSEAQRVYASGELTTNWLYIAAGRRYLPGPRTSFLAHPGLTGGLSPIPPARGTGSVFAFLPGSNFLPGVFALETGRGAGLFWADPNRTWFFAYHPGARKGALAASSALQTDSTLFAWTVDITGNARTTEGYARLRLTDLDAHADPSTGTKSGAVPAWQWLFVGERRESWDFRDYAGGALFPDRKGKSGLVYVRGDVQDTFSIEVGGQDIGQDGMRMLRLSGGLSPAESAFRLALDCGVYRRRTYDTENREYFDPAVGSALRASGANFFFSARLEQRRSTFTAGEFAGGLRAGPYRFEIAGIAREPLARTTDLRRATETTITGWETNHRIWPGGGERGRTAPFFFLNTDTEAEAGARFYREESGVLRLRLSGPHLYFLISAVLVAGRPRAFGQIQFQAPLESD